VEKQENGIFKLNKLSLEFNWDIVKEAIDNQNISFPIEISISFFASFLKNYPCSSSILISKVRFDDLILYLSNKINLRKRNSKKHFVGRKKNYH